MWKVKSNNASAGLGGKVRSSGDCCGKFNASFAPGPVKVWGKARYHFQMYMFGTRGNRIKKTAIIRANALEYA